MKKKVPKTSDENELITKGFLRQELDRLGDEFATKDFLKQEIDKSVSIVMAELGNMRKENREMYQMREQLYKSSIDQEFQIDDHEERIHKLEIAR
jgi:hypothetical protein